MEDYIINLTKGRKILFDWNSECLKDILELIKAQDHRTIIMWALENGERPLNEFERRRPGEDSPRNALVLSRQWAEGLIKMPAAKRAILDCHAAAKEINDKAAIACCHAIGQAAAAVHVQSHGPGLLFYWLSAIVYMAEKENAACAVNEEIIYLIKRLNYWKDNTPGKDKDWAEFLRK